MYKLTLIKHNGDKETLTQVHDLAWQGDYMIICMNDLIERKVRNLKDIEHYKITESKK